MKKEQIAITLFTLRDHCKTATDFALTIKRLRGIGYGAVQISGVGPISESEIVSILSGEGVVCCATHEGGETIINDTQKVIDRLGALGCTYTAYPFPAGVDMGSLEAVDAMIAGLDRAGAQMRKHGLVLTYHNHHLELRKLDEQTVLERIYANTNPLNLMGEIDTHWIASAGANPVTWCRRLANRLPLLHCKDLGVDKENKSNMTEVGSGNLEWAEIIAAAEQSGCRWFIVEQDHSWANNDPFESAKRSYDYMAGVLCV